MLGRRVCAVCASCVDKAGDRFEPREEVVQIEQELVCCSVTGEKAM